VGCRIRAAKSELVRVVAVGGACVPDPAARLPGRGAWLHPDPDCLDLAERRRALPRALRVPTVLDLAAVREWLTGAGAGPARTSAPTATPATTAQTDRSTADGKAQE
jgi:predicted RNA-binding protein YlxR (DUF448 family)